jgi:hypothetical protein
MKFRQVCVSMAWIAVSLSSGCGGPAEEEGGDGGNDGGGLDSALHDATRDTKPADGTLIQDAGSETQSDVAIVTEPDGTANIDASIDALNDGQGTAVTDARADGQDLLEADALNDGQGTAVTDARIDGQDVAAEAGVLVDAAEAAQDASFPSLSGCTYVTGTELAPTGALTASLGTIPCYALVAQASSGALTFSFTSTGCSVSYVNGSGAVFVSNLIPAFLPLPPGQVPPVSAFDGNTYTCSFIAASYSYDNFSMGACPETPDLSASVSFELSFTPATGAVSLSRDCEESYLDAFCSPTAFPMNNTSELQLAGSLSCADGGMDSSP